MGVAQMFQKKIVVGPLQCNCMILGCEKTKEAVVVDPGDEAPAILAALKAEGLNVKYILHTHAHFDHIAGTGELSRALTAPICLHKGDEELYNNLPKQGQLFGMTFTQAPNIEKFLDDEEILHFGDYRLQVLHTPGHSPGSVSFKLLNGPEAVYSGDTLFQQSVGRADLWGGDSRQLIKSIKERLLVFEGETPVYPGHGASTRIGDEKKQNPFLN